jgi:F-type H+-transporting ATPase subunit delta
LNAGAASRYARALADVALDDKDADRVRHDLGSLAEAFRLSADLRAFLESPSISHDLKHRAASELASRMDLVPAVRNCVFLLIDHHRTELLGEIRGAFEAELNARLGIAQAEVTSARELSDEERRKLTTALERCTGKRIEARFRRDESLVGGTVVRVGSTIYDGSVREQLMRLREQLETE